MLISTWLRSFRNRLQGQPRRPNRRSPEQASRTLEFLEARHLLAAPQLIDVQDEGGRVIASGQEIQNSPSTLVLDFSSTPDLDATTITTITLERAGQDGAFDGTDVQIPVTVSIVGAEPNEVVLQLGQTLPSDLYRINLPGTVANSVGEAFNGGIDSSFDFSIQLPPPSLVAVRPNVGEFLQDGETRKIAPNELTLQFNPGQILDPLSINTSTVQVISAGHDGTFGDGNESPVKIGYVGIGDVPEEVVIRFADNLPDDDYQIVLDGTSLAPIRSTSGEALNAGDSDTVFDFTLDLGARIIAIDPQPVTRDENTGEISQARNQIVLYFNDDNLLPASAETLSFYQLIQTNNTVSNLDDNNGGPAINPIIAAYDSDADTVTLTFANSIDALAGAGTYRLRVGTNESIPLAPTQTTIPAVNDPADSFDSPNVGNLGDLSVVKSQIISSAIEPQNFVLDFPGAEDEIGHRQIEIETHLLAGADAQDGITQIDYNFQDAYGFDPAGNILINTITAAQKQRAREVFEYYSTYLGIDFRETATSGFIIATGDLRALDPLVPTGPGGVTGIAGGGVAIMDQAEVWDDAPGSSWFQTALHEIGHLLGLGHASDLSPVTVNSGDGFGNTNTGAYNGFSEPVFPGDADLVHGEYLHRPDSIDIDLYRFTVATEGLFTAEVMAERLADSSLLDSQLRLFREDVDGNRTLIAQNDDYFSEDSYLELTLSPGTYFIGLSSTGNDEYDPAIPGTGFGGTSQGEYELRVNFRPDLTNPANVLVDETNTPLDGDSDGKAGGVYDFWFRATAEADTLFVDQNAADAATVGRLNNGSAASPFLEIDQALAASRSGQIVRIVGNGGVDGEEAVYQIGTTTANLPLRDGSRFDVPQNVAVMIDGGAILKLRAAGISVGSSTAGVDRSAGSLQVLGTPGNEVIFTSWLNENIGGDTTPAPTTAAPGNWGGIIFRNGIDRAEGRFNYQNEGIFLNHVSNALIEYGGGNIVLDSVLQTINPIFVSQAQPTIIHNTITRSLDAAISANPDSFEETTFHSPRYQEGAPAFTSDYTRVGPDIYWNTLVDNTTNGLFIRVQTTAGSAIEKLTVPGRFDDTDIVHVVAQNLEIQGTPGGPVLDEVRPDAALVVLTPVNSANGSLTSGSYNYRLVYVDINGFESPSSLATINATVLNPTSNGIQLSGLPGASGTYVGRRLYRSESTGTGNYTLVAELGRSETTYLDGGVNLGRILDTSVTARNRARFDARLSIDPGVVVKLEGSRIETGIGAQFIAEGEAGREIIFTSRLDDRFGAGGTFDTNNDGDLVTARFAFLTDDFESGNFSATKWNAGSTTAVIDSQGLAESSGSQSAHLRAGNILQTVTTNLNGQTAIEIQYSYQRAGSGTSPGNNGDLRLQYRDSGGVWRLVESQLGNGLDMTNFVTSTVRLPAGALHVNAAFRFVNTSGAGDWFVDDFRLLEARTDNTPTAGNWGGIYVGHLGAASIDQALVTFGGGIIPVGSDFAGFNAVEIHQATARITNTVFEENADGTGGSAPNSRFGLFSNSSGTIFVRGAQPVILDNEFRDNLGAVITINANSLNSDLVEDPGRSTGFADQNTSLVGNQGPLVSNNRLGGNAINGMVVRPATLTTQGVWDDTDIVHVLQNEILIPDFHTYGGLRLESSSAASLVVKLSGANAGFTANGYPIDIDDRIGGSLQVIGQPGQPVILTSLSDDSVGAGFDLLGLPLRDSNNDGPSTGSAGDWRSIRIAEYAHDANIAAFVENEVADPDSADVNNTIATSEVLGLLAADKKSGDENLRLGFEVHGVIDRTNDQDIYSFEGEAGTHIWIDIDRTSVGLDTVVELLDSSGNILAQSDNTVDEENGVYSVFTTGATQAFPLRYSDFYDQDVYSLNTADAGMRVTLTGAVGVRQSYFVRVRSSNLDTSSTPVVVFEDNFESGFLSPVQWASTGGADVNGGGLNESSGARSVNINNSPVGDVLESVDIDLDSVPGAALTYSFQRTGGGASPNVGEDLVLEYRNASGVWIELQRQLGAGADMGSFQKSSVTLPAGALHSNFAFRISTSSPNTDFTGDWFVDDVEVAVLPSVNRTSLQSNSSLNDGLTTGAYQLQVRLRDVDEVPGSQITNADVRFATTGIEVLGQPIHSLITGEAQETNGVTVLPNVLNSDRGAISVSGRLSDPLGQELDVYEFQVAYDVTQTIAGDGDDSAHVPVIFDLDYADGFSRANTSIAVFNDQNELILIGRDSNISDDQAKPLDSADVDDTSRGSVGKTDPYIGPVELISGTYRMYVFSNDRVPAVLDQFFVANPTSSLIRVEPVNSTTRIAEERFDDSEIVFDSVTGQVLVDPDTGEFILQESASLSTNPFAAPITDLFTVQNGIIDPSHVVPFTLGDVTLFVSQDGGTKNGDRTALYTVDPFTGQQETVVGGFDRIVGDIGIRADGQLHALTTYDAGVTGNPNNLTDGGIGNYLRIDTGTAAATQVGDDGVTTLLVNGNASPAHNVGTQYQAFTYSGSSNGNDLADMWAIGSRSTQFNKTNQAGSLQAEYVSNILYNLNIASGTVDGDGNNRRTDTSFGGSDGAGTTQFEHGYVDTNFSNGGLEGIITGMVTLDGGSTFYGVDDAGGLYQISRFGFNSSTYDPRLHPNPVAADMFSTNVTTTFLRNIGADATGAGGLNLEFQGLALGPENVEGGLYSQILFGITADGEMYAFDTSGDLAPVFVDGQSSVSTGLTNVNGLAFGTLDYNLWHITSRRGGATAADDGHGIDVAPFDNSVVLPQVGGSSLHFGFEGGNNTPDPSFGGNTQSGNKNTNLGNNQINNAAVTNIDFPGGAHGSVVSNGFSLEGYSTNDKPTLYFNYYLDTEDANYDYGPNPDTLMRDALRVFVQDETGAWNLLVTNNSQQDSSLARPDEYDIGAGQTLSDGVSNNPSGQTFPDVVEAFDNANWRQARVDLSNYAGMSDLKLRFDFSTAGSMDLGNIRTAGSELYAVAPSELTDGDTITLGDYDGNGILVGQTTFEFDLGAHLTLPSGNAAIGESFRVQGPGYDETFTFTPTADPLNINEILALPSDSAADLAARTSAQLDAIFGGFRMQLPGGGSLQNESFRFNGETFTFTANPVAGTNDILAEFGDTGATIASRTAAKVNSVLGGAGNFAFVNGDLVDLFNGTLLHFGGSLDITGGSSLEGESFTVKGTTFTFTTTPLLPTDINLIDGFSIATNDVITQRAADAINAEFGVDTFGFDWAFVDPNVPTRLSVPNLETSADAFFTGGTLNLTDVVTDSTFQFETFTLFGQTFTFVATPSRPTDIQAEVGDSAAVVAARVRTAIDSQFGAGTVLPLDPAAPDRVSVPRIAGFANAFKRGSVIQITDPGDLEKYEFELLFDTYRFTSLPDPNRTGEILARSGDPATAVAAEAVRVINLESGFGFNTVAFQDLDRIHIPDLSSTFQGINHNSFLDFSTATPENIEGDSFTVFDTTYTFTTNPLFSFQLPDNAVDIDYDSTFTADDFANAAATAINAKLATDLLTARATPPTTTVGEIVGVDFGPAGDVSPTGWTSATANGGVGFTLTNLPDELGGATPFDLNVGFFAGFGNGSDAANTPDANLPAHTTALDNIDGALTASGDAFNATVLTFSDLTPGERYDVYLFGGDAATSGSQDVSIFGSTSLSFTQAWTNEQFVNGSASSASVLDSFAVPVQANSSGEITIQVTNSVGGDVVVPAVAIRESPNLSLVQISGAVTTDVGTTVTVNGPNAAAINGDTLIADFQGLQSTFTYQAAVPTTTLQIQTSNSTTTTAANTAQALNDRFNQFNFFGTNFLPAFSASNRVSIPFDSAATFTDGADGSLIVSDYARLSINGFDNVDGDVLTVSGAALTFVDTVTPAAGEIGSNGAGTWTATNIAAAINTRFGANNALVSGNQVLIYRTPTFGGVLSYTDPGNDGLTIIDAGSSRDQFTFSDGTTPLTGQLPTDRPGSPITVDNEGTILSHDTAGSPIASLPPGVAQSFGNRVTVRSASALTLLNPAGSLSASGEAGTAESNSGLTFTLSTDANQLDGDELLVPDPGFFGSPVTFTFVNGPATGPFEIQTGANVAINAKVKIEAHFGQLMFTRSLNSLTLTSGVGQVTFVDSIAADRGITFAGGLSLPTISIDVSMSVNDVALAIRQGLANVYAATDVNNIKGHEDLIHIIGHDIIDVGPLRQAVALPGDEFGAFDAGYVNSQSAQRPGSLRGMNNAIEGVFIDDIIIGFAERGEMITNAPGNTGFIQNDDVAMASDAPGNAAAFDEFGQPNVYLDILNGVYDVEIRRASDFGVSQTGDPTNVLYRTLDTNDREIQGISIRVPDSTVIPDRSTFSVSNGVNTVTYQFVDIRGAVQAPDPGNIRVLYDPINGLDGTAQDNQELIARLIVAAINSQASQAKLSPAGTTDEFGVQAIFSDTTGSTSSQIHLSGNATFTPDPTLAQRFVVTTFNFTGDQNRERAQGQIIISSSFVTNSLNFGISVDAGARTDGLAHPGSARTTQEENPLALAPGIVITNNVIVQNTAGGIRYSGDQGTNPDGISPVGRIVNNTIVGVGGGTGILVNDGASPTLLNNIVANFGTGITATGGSIVIGSTLYQNNGVNSNAGLGTFPITLLPTDPLFVDAAGGNYYPAPGSRAIDSSLKSLGDNPEIVRVKTPLGGGLSPLLAPELDAYGQVRGDDDTVDTPSAQGGNVTLDRGAIDRVDFYFFQPIAVLGNPEDNGANDLDPTPGRVFATIPDDLREFRIRLDDQGIGVDDARVNSNQFVLQQDGVDLIEGIHYIWSYNSVTNEVTFTAVTTFPLERRYTMIVENQPFDPANSASIDGVRDLAGNYLEANQTDGRTVFEILLTDNVNDAPINGVPSARQRITEDATLVFSPANGNAITVSDADIHLSQDASLNVTLASTFGTMSLASTQGLTFLTGNTGTDEASITFRGTVTDINIALDGLTFTPLLDYSNLFSGDTASLNPATITITTDDGNLANPPVGQFAAPDSPVETDIDVVLIDVEEVNDAPSFTTPVTAPPAIDEDASAVVIPSFVTGMTAGPLPSEQGQTFSFNVGAPVIVSGNLQFTQAPAISPTGELTYAVAGDTNGTAQFTFSLTDANATDPNHVPASSAPVTVDIVVNPINDKPLLTVSTTTVSGVEDEGLRTAIPLVSSATAGPATATDETDAATGQALTFMASAPVSATGNLTFTTFNVSPTDGSLTFEATPNSSGTATFSLWVQDDGPTAAALDDNVSAAQTITISVSAVGDPPVAVTPNYAIDEGDLLQLNASGSSDPDTLFPGDVLTYSWDLNNDGVFDIVNQSSSTIDIPFSTLQSLNLAVPGVNPITLRVTDTFQGTSDEAAATVTIQAVDYGDAPDSYGTLKASNGASHTILPGFYLGNSVDSEIDAQADDGADEDGIVFEAGIQAGTSIDIGSFFTATASAAGKLDIWVDFDLNGTFDANEHLNGGSSYDLVQGANQFDFTIAAGRASTTVDTPVRARFSSAGGLTPTGRASDGEVEDLTVRFSALLDAVAVQSVLPAHPQTSDSTPIIQWEAVPNTPPGSNATYNVELRNALGQVVGFQEGHVGESLTISDPLAPGVYTAFITSINRAGVALLPASQLTSFEVVAMTVTSPSDVIQDNTPTISWTSVDSTDHYELQIRSGLTGNPVLEELNLTGTSYTLDPALDIGSYQVRVRAVETTTGQIGDWSSFQSFTIGTSPNVTAPAPATGQTAAEVTIGNPTITWDAVQGAATYEVVINDVTDAIIPIQRLTGLTGTSVTLTQPLELGEYTIQVRAVTVDSLAGEYSVPRTLFVRRPTVAQTTSEPDDSTPTITWTAVPGAEQYDLQIVRTVGTVEEIAYSAAGMTGTIHTVPASKALPIGQYEIRVTARNLPAAASTGQTVSSLNVRTSFLVATPPVILLPNSGIYDTTPEITWTSPAGTAVSTVTVTNALTNQVVFTRSGITGNSVVTDVLPPGEYRAVVTSSTDVAPIVTSVPSSIRVFRIGSAPIPLGPSQGLGNAPFFEVVDKRPTLTWQQSLAGETFSVWLTDVTNQKLIKIATGLQEASYTVQQDLPVGRYRYWARADNGLGDQSSWSAPFVFDVKTRPVLATVQPTFNPRPTFTWNTQPEIDQYRVFIRRVDVTPNVDMDTGFTVTGNQYTPTQDLPKGKYRIWIKGVNETTVSKGTVETIWSIGQDFEISGRPIVTSPGSTDDSTPVIRWSPVGDASSYQLYVAPANAAGNPVINISGLTATSFQVSDPLPNGSFVAWVRATSITGEVSPWSVTTLGQFTITGSTAGGVDRVVVSEIPTANDRTPTFTWTPDASADHYDIFVSARSATNVALIRDTNVSGTTFTSTRLLAPGQYRVWVRAIGADGFIGPWSVPVDFTVTATDTADNDATGIVMLASMKAVSEALQVDQVSVGLMQQVVANDHGPAEVEEPTEQQVTQRPASQPDATIVDAKNVAFVPSDDVMAQWDESIWAEESAGQTVAAATEATVEPETKASRNWLAGLAMVSTSLFKRRQKKSDE